CVNAYPDLFPDGPFDARYLSGLSLGNAFGSPWATADQLRIATRTSLWVCAVDWMVDYVATSRDEFDGAFAECLAVAEGRPPALSVPIACFLAEIRDELAEVPVFPTLLPVWRDELQRLLEAMAREWAWKSACSTGREAALPTFEEYLDNAATWGSSWVNISHW